MRMPRRRGPRGRKAPAEDIASVTVCLLSWKRPHNLPGILATLRDLWFVGEILIWNNDTSVELVIDAPKTRVIDSDRNLICFGRFACAAKARNEVIYVQDDD